MDSGRGCEAPHAGTGDTYLPALVPAPDVTGTVGDWSVRQIDGMYSWQVLVTDLDRDGNLDLLDAVDHGPILTFYGDGKGSFVPSTSVQDPDAEMRQPLGFNTADLKGDGWLDLIGLDSVYLRAFLNPGNRSGGWASVGPPSPLWRYGEPRCVAVDQPLGR